MNEIVEALAQKIADELVSAGHVWRTARSHIKELVGKVIQEEMFPDKCPDCGAPLCPECGNNLEPPLQDPKTEFEGYHVCFNCGIYVKPDRATLPVEDGDCDRRFAYAPEAFGVYPPSGEELN